MAASSWTSQWEDRSSSPEVAALTTSLTWMAHGCPNASWPQPVYQAFCTAPAPPPPPEAECEDKYTTKTACDADKGCSWCTSAAVPPSCERISDIKHLPPSVFTCDKRNSTEQHVA